MIEYRQALCNAEFGVLNYADVQKMSVGQVIDEYQILCKRLDEKAKAIEKTAKASR